MSPEKMVTMANQIAAFFDGQPGSAPDRIADHLKDYWEPRMREQLRAYCQAGGTGLRPSVEQAVQRL